MISNTIVFVKECEACIVFEHSQCWQVLILFLSEGTLPFITKMTVKIKTKNLFVGYHCCWQRDKWSVLLPDTLTQPVYKVSDTRAPHSSPTDHHIMENYELLILLDPQQKLHSVVKRKWKSSERTSLELSSTFEK